MSPSGAFSQWGLREQHRHTRVLDKQPRPSPTDCCLQRHDDCAAAMSKGERRTLSVIAGCFATLALIGDLLRTRATWLEYYTDGTPYYGRTTNLDKWESPVMDLVTTDAIHLALLVGFGAIARRLWRIGGGARESLKH